jgi:hypothetical protein
MYKSKNVRPIGILISNSVDPATIPDIPSFGDFSDLKYCQDLLTSFLKDESDTIRLIWDDELVYVIKTYHDEYADLIIVTRTFAKDSNVRGSLRMEVPNVGIMINLKTGEIGIAMYPEHREEDTTIDLAGYKKDVEEDVIKAVKYGAYLSCVLKSKGDLDELFSDIESKRVH